MKLSTTSYSCNNCIRSLHRNPRLIRNPETISVLNQRRRYGSQQNERPFRMAVIGSGPAGFYTAYKVMSRIENAKIDMYEHLPTPFGLVRYGVAPDHPEVKNCQDKFEEVAKSPNFSFIGNISIGSDPSSLPFKSLLPHYDAILFAYGASKDKKFGVPGENLKGVYSARAFVGWYNGLPEYADLAPELDRGEDAVVIGQGNVALDVTRILLSPLEALRKTDITEEALEVLSRSRVNKVRVVGRRGPGQVAFTTKEVRELLAIHSVNFHPMQHLPPPAVISKLPRTQKRLLDMLSKASIKASDRGPDHSSSSKKKSWSLDFLLSPTTFSNEGSSDPTYLSKIQFQHNQLMSDNNPQKSVTSETKEAPEPESFINLSSTAKVQPITDCLSLWPTDVAFRSIGYQSEALVGFEDSESSVPFDAKRGIICNDGIGRVVKPATAEFEDGETLPGMYCAGWVKRGPTGVIASTMEDAFATAEAIASDWFSKTRLFLNNTDGNGWEGDLEREASTRGCRRISWEDWKKIDREEKRKGSLAGKERVKFRRVEDMLAVLD